MNINIANVSLYQPVDYLTDSKISTPLFQLKAGGAGVSKDMPPYRLLGIWNKQCELIQTFRTWIRKAYRLQMSSLHQDWTWPLKNISENIITFIQKHIPDL